MAEILSLSKARKAKARIEQDATATQNRARFGRSKADKALDAAKKKLAENRIDGAKRET